MINCVTLYRTTSSLVTTWKDPIWQVAARALKQIFSSTALPAQLQQTLVYGAGGLVVANIFARLLLEGIHRIEKESLVMSGAFLCSAIIYNSQMMLGCSIFSSLRDLVGTLTLLPRLKNLNLDKANHSLKDQNRLIEAVLHTLESTVLTALAVQYARTCYLRPKAGFLVPCLVVIDLTIEKAGYRMFDKFLDLHSTAFRVDYVLPVLLKSKGLLAAFYGGGIIAFTATVIDYLRSVKNPGSHEYIRVLAWMVLALQCLVPLTLTAAKKFIHRQQDFSRTFVQFSPIVHRLSRLIEEANNAEAKDAHPHLFNDAYEYAHLSQDLLGRAIIDKCKKRSLSSTALKLYFQLFHSFIAEEAVREFVQTFPGILNPQFLSTIYDRDKILSFISVDKQLFDKAGCLKIIEELNQIEASLALQEKALPQVQDKRPLYQVIRKQYDQLEAFDFFGVNACLQSLLKAFPSDTSLKTLTDTVQSIQERVEKLKARMETLTEGELDSIEVSLGALGLGEAGAEQILTSLNQTSESP